MIDLYTAATPNGQKTIVDRTNKDFPTLDPTRVAKGVQAMLTR